MSLEGLHLPGAVLGHLIGVLKMLSNQSRARCICQRQWKSNCSLMFTCHTHNTRICTTNTQYGHCSSTHCRHAFHTHIYHIHGVFICTGTTHACHTQTPRRTIHAQHTWAIHAHMPQPHMYHIPPTPTTVSLHAQYIASHTWPMWTRTCTHTPHTMHTPVVTSTCNN